MKKSSFLTLVTGALIASSSLSSAQPKEPASPTATPAAAPTLSPEERDMATAEKHTKPVMKELKLEDAAKEASVHATVVDYMLELKQWHTKNDPQIKALWTDFDHARAIKPPDQVKADEALAKIDKVYADFKPQHNAFLAKLNQQLTPEQVESVKDAITIHKVKVTYNVYNQIFHGLTADQNAFILKNLKAAREEGMDATDIKETSALFKKYKIKIEAYLTAQGYDVKQSYSEFVAKQKAEAAEKKAASASASQDSKPADKKAK